MSGPQEANEAIQSSGMTAEPVPIRFWWLKRILTVSGVLLIALLCLWWWWGWEADRRLQAGSHARLLASMSALCADMPPCRMTFTVRTGGTPC